ncbi:MAG: extracellular solute-binding protein [Planctomycetota bacterium]
MNRPLVIAAYDMPATDGLANQIAEYTRSSAIPIRVSRFTADQMEKQVLASFETGRDTFDIVDVSTAAVEAFSPHLLDLMSASAVSQPLTPEDLGGWRTRTLNTFGRSSTDPPTTLRAVPYRGDAYLTFYRLDLFEQLGLDTPTTLERLLATAEIIQNSHVVPYGFVSSQRRGLHVCLDWLNVYWGFGQRLWDANGSTRLTAGSAEQAIRYYQLRSAVSDPKCKHYGYYEPLEVFLRGDAGIMQNWSMCAGQLESPGSPLRGRVGYLPAAGHALIGGGGLGISRYSRHVDESLKLIQWLASEPIERERVVTHGGSPTRLSSFRDSEVKEQCPHVKAIDQAFHEGRGRPVVAQWNRIQDWIADAVWAVCFDSADLQQRFGDLTNHIQEVLDDNSELAVCQAIASLDYNAMEAKDILRKVLDGYAKLRKATYGFAATLTGGAVANGDWVTWRMGPGVPTRSLSSEIVRSILDEAKPVVVLNQLDEPDGWFTVAVRLDGERTDPNARNEPGPDRPNGIMAVQFPHEVRVRARERLFLGLLARQVAQSIEVAAVNRRQRIESETQRRLREQLLQAQKLESIGTMVTGVAHEFRNALASMVNYAELARTQLNAPSEADSSLQKVLSQSQDASEIIRELLEFAGQREDRREPCRLDRLVSDSVQFLRGVMPESILVQFKVDANEGAVCLLNPVQIKQVMTNLLINARDAIQDRGTVTVRVGESSFGPDYVSICVTDDGKGMDPDTATRVFDPFFTTKSTGTGLGLAVVHGIVQSHQGMIHIDSEPGGGTTVAIDLPKTDRRAGESTPTPAPAKPSVQQDLTGRLVLIVDDDPMVRESTAALLEASGARVIMASNGDEARAWSDEIREHSPAVLMDWNLPETDPLKLLKDLAELDPDGTRLIVTGRADDVDRADVDPLIDGVLTKPIAIGQLIDRLCRDTPRG